MRVALTFVLSLLVSHGSSVPLDKLFYSSDGCPYYIESGQRFNWYQAWEECLLKNMTLLTIDTLYKQQQIDGIIRQSFPKNVSVWLAGHDNAVDLRYVWVTTGKEFSFTNWAPTHPNRLANEHCIFIHDSTNQWHDQVCSSKYGYICEKYQCSNNGFPERYGISLRTYNIGFWN